MNYNAALIKLVNDFIAKTRMLISLLQADAEYFKENNLEQLEINNGKKNNVNHLLAEIVSNLQTIPKLAAFNGNLYDKLGLHAKTLPSNEKPEFEKLLETMNDEIKKYNQCMIVNRNVVNLNLAYIKDLFFTLLNNKANDNANGTYGRSGMIEG